MLIYWGSGADNESLSGDLSSQSKTDNISDDAVLPEVANDGLVSDKDGFVLDKSPGANNEGSRNFHPHPHPQSPSPSPSPSPSESQCALGNDDKGKPISTAQRKSTPKAQHAPQLLPSILEAVKLRLSRAEYSPTKRMQMSIPEFRLPPYVGLGDGDGDWLCKGFKM